MVYHRSESGAPDKRQHRNDSDPGSRDSRRDDRDNSNSREGQYSESRWRGNDRDDRYARSSRDAEGSDRFRMGGQRDDRRVDHPQQWGHGGGNFQYNPGPRFNPPPFHEPVGFMPPMMPTYPIDNFQYLNAEAQKAEEDKKKNVFQNDGSFLEMFKRMQENKSPVVKTEPSAAPAESAPGPSAAAAPAAPPKKLALPLVGKRRGGRILKTGMVKKLKVEKPEDEEPKNAWSIYMNEVRKYKEASCEEEGKTRPLVK